MYIIFTSTGKEDSFVNAQADTKTNGRTARQR